MPVKEAEGTGTVIEVNMREVNVEENSFAFEAKGSFEGKFEVGLSEATCATGRDFDGESSSVKDALHVRSEGGSSFSGEGNNKLKDNGGFEKFDKFGIGLNRRV